MLSVVELRVAAPFARRIPALAPGEMVLPVAVIGPTVPVPPSAPEVRLTALAALLPLMSRVPSLIDVAPEYEFVAPRTKVPAPILVRFRLPPPIAPPRVNVCDVVALMVLLLANVIGPVMEQPTLQRSVNSDPFPLTPSPLNVTASGTLVTSELSESVAPLAT